MTLQFSSPPITLAFVAAALLIDPLTGPALLVLPGFARERPMSGSEHVARAVRLFDECAKVIAEVVHVRMDAARQPAESEVSKAAFQQVFGRKPSDFPMIHANKR